MILPLLVSLMALNLVQAKHFLVETEDNKDEDNKDKDNKANTIHIHITHIQQLNISLHFSSHSHFYYQLNGKNNTNILTMLYKELNQVPLF